MRVTTGLGVSARRTCGVAAVLGVTVVATMTGILAQQTPAQQTPAKQPPARQTPAKPAPARPAPAPARTTSPPAAEARPLRILFLGHDQPKSHHTPALFPLLASPLAHRGIQLTHVLTPAEALDPDRLANYDGLMIYGNHLEITPAQEKALLDFVEGGKGLIAIHCASYMFHNSDKYIALVGGQFQRHGTGEFTAEIVKPDHPALAGVKPFATWDETYVHTKHNPVDRTVLMERVDQEGREPYTWVRTQGKGRVFYTAFGHDKRTWSNPGFHALVAQGTVWAVDDSVRQRWTKLKMPALSYVDGFNVPNYEKRDPPPKYQLPLTPREAMLYMQTSPEFSVELFASEPDIVRPIAFQFDERGRLWLLETVDYPNEPLDGSPGDDRIRILEDTNGDGRADKFTVFADHLNIPTSLVFANDGVIVSQAPHMLFLKDTNGDGKADVRKILSTGWGTADTHAGPSNLQYGPDNYIWGVVGYSGFKGEMNGKPMQFLQGAYRFKPDGSQFEFMTGSTNNTWGLGFSETFDVFGSTANNEPSFYMAIPNRHFEGVTGLPAVSRNVGPGYQGLAAFYQAHAMTPYIRQVDVHGGYTSAAGHNLYTARAFPKDYWNRIALITRTDRPHHRPGHPREAGRGIRHARRLEPDCELRGVVRARARPGRAGRRRLDRGLVQLHRPAQSDAARIQQRTRQRLRDLAPRRSPRPHLPDRLQEGASGDEAVAVQGRSGGPRRRVEVRQHVLATARTAPAGRAGTARRRAPARGAGEGRVGRRDRHQRSGAPCPLDAAWARGDGRARPVRFRRRSRGAQAPGRRRAQGRDDGAAKGGGVEPCHPRGRRAGGCRPAHAARGGARPRGDAGVARDRPGGLQGEPEAGELRRQVAEPRILHCREPAPAKFPDDLHAPIPGSCRSRRFRCSSASAT